jgi:hypothetical protein
MSNNKIDQYAAFISSQVKSEGSVKEDVEQVTEAASEGKEHSSNGITHKVIHNDGKNHMTMTYGDEPGSVYFHGRMDGHKIRVDSEGTNGRDPSKKHVESDLKHHHPDLPPATHKKIMDIASKGLKHISGE